MPDIISFEDQKDRRDIAAINKDAVDWEVLHINLVEAIVRSGLSDTSVVSAGLRAILDTLTESGMTLDEAKKRVALSLNAFW